MTDKIYTGIGSRKTPPQICHWMSGFAKELAKQNWTLRSGAADGADAAFEDGAISVNGPVEIYLPWARFNDHGSVLHEVTEEAMDLASKFHPKWDELKDSVRKLHARNCQQVLGQNLDKPTSFILCWTKRGQMVGGTAQALRVAKEYNIPIMNFGWPGWRAEWEAIKKNFNISSKNKE